MLSSGLLVVIIIVVLLFVTRKKHVKGYPPGPLGIPLLGYLPWPVPDPHTQIGKLGKRYGSIFSVQLGSYSFVVLNDLEAVKEALKLDVFAGRPNHLLAMSIVKLGLAYNEGPGLVEQRRFAVRTLRDFGFGKKSMEASVQEEVAGLVDYFRTQLDQSICIKEIFAVSIINALWSIITGEKFALTDPKPREFYKIGKEGFMDPEIQGATYVLPWLAKLFPGLTGFTKTEECCRLVKQWLLDVVQEHQRTFVPNAPRDYIDMYLEKMAETTNPESSFFRQAGIDNLVDGLCALFMGGSDTLTCTMEFTLLYLITHPDVRVKIQAELDKVVGRTRVPDIHDRPNMPYLNAVMQESMRMSAVLAGCIVHSTMDDTDFMGYKLPKGSIIMPNIYQVHHDEDYWKDPEIFRPERFINQDGSFRKDENVIPFSTGKRACPAENLAMTEYYLFLANLLQAFDIRADPNYPLPGLAARKPAFVLSPQSYRIIFSERV